MKVIGAEQLQAVLRNIGKKVPENARKVMHRGADKIVERAKLFAPHDTGALEDSIHKEVSYESAFGGRLAIDVIAGGFVDGVNVDDYASEVHENYDTKNEGPGTIAKQNEHPDVLVGGKFLERAVDEQEPKLQANMIETIVAVVKDETK